MWMCYEQVKWLILTSPCTSLEFRGTCRMERGELHWNINVPWLLDEKMLHSTLLEWYNRGLIWLRYVEYWVSNFFNCSINSRHDKLTPSTLTSIFTKKKGTCSIEVESWVMWKLRFIHSQNQRVCGETSCQRSQMDRQKSQTWWKNRGSTTQLWWQTWSMEWIWSYKL